MENTLFLHSQSGLLYYVGNALYCKLVV